MSAVSVKKGLCLSGGGVTGAMYQVGCLAALEDRVESLQASGFDLYVATASGATVAMGLAGGLSVQRLYRALLDPADDFFPLQRNHLLRLDRAEMTRVFGSSLAAARRVLGSVAQSPLDLDVWNELDRFVDSLPAGIFTLDSYERFLVELMERRGIPQRFADMPRELLIVASDLDAGRRAVFGEGELAHIAVARAVCAASALPILYAPVSAGGRDYVNGGMGGAVHVDLAAARDCKLVFVVNTMVPAHAGSEGKDVPTGHGPKARVRDKGAIWVYNQAMRMRNEAGVHEGIERVRARHPETDIVLLEPKQSDVTLFMHSPMNFAARRAILQEGYTSTVRRLAEEGSDLRRTLARHGLGVVE